jgi:hypothetical protein
LDLACSWRQLPLQGLGSNDLRVSKAHGEHLLALPAQAGRRRGLLLDLYLSHIALSPADSMSTLTPVGAGDLPAPISSYWRSTLPAGLQALVEQAIEYLATAWALRRWWGPP